jgi:hypothetical protein
MLWKTQLILNLEYQNNIIRNQTKMIFTHVLRHIRIICPNNETFVFIAGRSVTFLDCNYVDTVTSIIDLSVVSLSGITFFFARKFIYFMSVYIRNISFLEYNFGLSGTLHLSEIYWFAYHYKQFLYLKTYIIILRIMLDRK